MIAELISKVGKEGSITVEDGKRFTHETEFVEGMKIEKGYISPYFMTNPKNMKCEFEDCSVFVTNEKLTRP